MHTLNLTVVSADAGFIFNLIQLEAPVVPHFLGFGLLQLLQVEGQGQQQVI